uniref:Glycerol-3-phosphate dehydrogenase n=1 Tax=Phaffia rhodozyma TaxID=264483 RepID=A0A1C9UKZ4_PHARH|nr:glycerol-3-phosphate dehydrogenase [Phaffia rhodozyma]
MFRHALPRISKPYLYAGAITTTALVGTTYALSNSPLSLEAATRLNEKSKYSRPGPLWSPPTRAQMIDNLKKSGKGVKVAKFEEKDQQEFDLLVVGGGATGSGVALDAASRGLKVALVERDDFSSGTSSKSTKLVHGGVRYLQKAIFELDYDQYKLVVEALRERRIFLETAPYLSHMLPILLPTYTWWQLPYYYVGCKMYDILAGSEGGNIGAYWMGKSKVLDAFPMLKQEGLTGGVVYYDGQHNDSRMNMALILSAVHNGATVANYVSVVALLKDEAGKLRGARVRDELNGEEWEVKAKGIINATGPFSDGLRKLDEPMTQEIVAPSSGVHITLPAYYGPKTMGLLDPNTSDGRVIFFLPWQGNVIAGTTDAPTNVEQNPIPSEKEIQWILDEVRNYLSPDIKVRRGDVLSAWSGIRPLVRDPAAKDTQSLVRNHMINISESGLLTIAGGKWTTYRAMAEETVDEAVKHFGLKTDGKSETAHIKLIGSHGWTNLMFVKLIQQFGLDIEVAKHLSENYGDRAWTICSMAAPTGYAWPLHGIRLSPNYPVIEAEVRYACRFEYAQHAADFIGRRSRLSFLNTDATISALPRILEIMASELGWNQERVEKEFDSALYYLRSMGLAEHKANIKLADVPRVTSSISPARLPGVDEAAFYSRALFTPEEVADLKIRFQKMDFDQDEMITAKDLKHALSRLGYSSVEDETIQAIISEVDFDRRGAIFFDDFCELAAGMKELSIDSAFTHITMGDSDYFRNKISPEKSGGGV